MVRLLFVCGVVISVFFSSSSSEAGVRLPDGARKIFSFLATKTKALSAKRASNLAMAAGAIATCAILLSCDDMNLDKLVYNDIIVSDEVAGGLAIMQGVTTSNQTQLFILTEANREYTFSLVDGFGNESLPVTTSRDRYNDPKLTMQRILFQELLPGAEYLLQVRSADTEEILDERVLSTLNTGQHDLRFAFTSCMLDYYDQGDMWEQMVMREPDVIFLIGDNVYADALKEMADPTDLWTRYFETRSKVNLFRNKRLIPVVATWDDHDYGMNNAGRDYPHKDVSLAVFKDFFASDQTDNFYMPGIGVASAFEIYGYNFFLTDNRTFRTPLGESPQRHFGDEQMQWLLSNLQGKEHAFIVSGDQFFGGYTIKDSFQGHHRQRFAYFLDELSELGAEVVFMSGDKHYTEIMEIPEDKLGYKTYELTASPMHANAKTFPDFLPNALRIEGADGVYNFMVVEVNEVGGGLRLMATSYTMGGRVLYSGEYTVIKSNNE